MFVIKFFSGCVVSRIGFEQAAAVARENLRIEDGESLAWSGSRLIVVDRIGNFTPRWAEVVPA